MNNDWCMRCPRCAVKILAIMAQTRIEDDGQVGEVPVLACCICRFELHGRYENGVAWFPPVSAR